MGKEIAPAQLERHLGSLYSMGEDHVIKHHIDNIDISNGLAWSLDNKTMYYIDSLARQVYAFDYDISTGSICTSSILYLSLVRPPLKYVYICVQRIVMLALVLTHT
jgi:sugar lactone lactonase YvrE